MQEVIEKRTRSSKTHSLGGRKFSWDGTIGSVHYEDNGWQEIDNIFEPALAPWNWEMLKAGYHIRVKEDFTAGQIIEFEVKGETNQFQPMAFEWTNDLDQIQLISMPQNVTPVITNPVVDLLPAVGMPSHQGSILWPNGYGNGINFKWQCTSTRLVKTLEIENFNNLPVPEQYILDGGNPVLRLNLIFDPPARQNVDIVVDGEVWNRTSKKQTFKIIEFRKDGEVLWGFMPLKYWGSGTDLETNEGQSIATLEKRGNKLYISIRVPYEWLQTAVYPVFIDTDVDEQVVDTYDDANEKDSNGNMYRDDGDDRIGDFSFTRYHAGWRFQTVNVPQGADLTTSPNSHLTFYPYKTSSITISYTWYGHKVPNAGAFTLSTNNITGRDRTTANVNENPPADWVINSWVDSADISVVLEEIFSAGNSWVAENALALLGIYISGASYNESKRITSRNLSSSLSAKLHIEYGVGAPEGQPYISRVQGVQGMRSYGGI